MLGTVATIAREEGLSALWKGIIPGLHRQFIYGGLRIGLYEPVSVKVHAYLILVLHYMHVLYINYLWYRSRPFLLAVILLEMFLCSKKYLLLWLLVSKFVNYCPYYLYYVVKSNVFRIWFRICTGLLFPHINVLKLWSVYLYVFEWMLILLSRCHSDCSG